MSQAPVLASTVALDAIRDAVEAEFVAVLAEGESPDRLRVLARAGPAAEDLPDEIHAPPGSMIARVQAGILPGRLTRLALISAGTSGRNRRLGPSLVVPMTGSDFGPAVLLVSRRISGRAFGDTELDQVRRLVAAWGGADTLGSDPVPDLAAFGGEMTFRQAFEKAAAGMSLVGAGLRYRWVNDPLCVLLGRTRAQLLALDVTDTVHPDHVDRAVSFYDRLRAGDDDAVRDRFMFHRPGGDRVWAEVGGSVVGNGTGSPLFFVQHLDVTLQQQEMADDFAYRAMHDDLTGLANRALLRDRLHSLLARPLRGGPRTAAFYVDVDRFKAVNDTYGHTAGDAVLVETARRLNSVVRAGDTVARVGGDEFVVAGEVTGSAEALQMAGRLATALRPRIDIGGRLITVSISIGVALSAPHDRPDDLVAKADRALLGAKRPKMRIVPFAP